MHGITIIEQNRVNCIQQELQRKIIYRIQMDTMGKLQINAYQDMVWKQKTQLSFFFLFVYPNKIHLSKIFWYFMATLKFSVFSGHILIKYVTLNCICMEGRLIRMAHFEGIIALLAGL